MGDTPVGRIEQLTETPGTWLPRDPARAAALQARAERIASHDDLRRLAAELPPLSLYHPMRPQDIEALQRTGEFNIQIAAGSLALSLKLILRDDWPAGMFPGENPAPS